MGGVVQLIEYVLMPLINNSRRRMWSAFNNAWPRRKVAKYSSSMSWQAEKEFVQSSIRYVYKTQRFPASSDRFS
jgi:hypothetical protein